MPPSPLKQHALVSGTGSVGDTNPNTESASPTGSRTLISNAWRSVRRRGLLDTVALVPKNILWGCYRWRDTRFDRRYGVDTSGLVGLQSLNVVGGSRDGCNYYAPVPAKSIKRIIAALPIDPRHYTFVDIGTGKGRPALLASMAGFRRVIGVEFSPELAEIAERNAALFHATVPTATDIEIVCDDATVWPIPEEDSVLFMFNPFGEPVMRKFIDHVGRSYRRHGQHIVIAYYHPTCAAVLDEAEFLGARTYKRLPFDPNPENTFETGTEGHGVDVPYDLIIYQTEPGKRDGT